MVEDVRVRGVVKSFGSREVLRGIDLSMAPGAMTAILGPSGCGKTTLLRIIAGFTDPDAGGVDIGGHPMAGVPAHRRRVGLLPQEGALFPYKSVGENVAFGLPRGAGVDRVAHWLDVVGLSGLTNARPHELSGGQQQRVALARALAAQPRVILLDEPFAALDAGLRVRVREEIAAILSSTGTTSVLVTHDQAEALSLADSVAVLLDGTVVQHGPPTELYQRPAALSVARFVGATVELDGKRSGASVRSALGLHPVVGDAPDGPVTVMLRPEQLLLADDGAPAVVTAVHYYGADQSVHVDAGDGAALVLRVPGDVEVLVGAQVGVTVRGAVLAYSS